MTDAPYRHRRGLLRLLDRYRRPVAAVLTALAAIGAVLVLRPPPEPTTQVWVAARDLDASGPLGESDITGRTLPDRLLPEGVLTPDDPPTGLVPNAPVRAGEVLTDARLGTPPAAPYGPDMVAVPVRVSDPGAVALLSPGSRVDVLAARATDDLGGPPTRAGPAVDVVDDRPVLAVPAEDGVTGEGGALILIAATAEQARVLAGHATGSRLSVTIRG
ncbi:SAF domain-containing protein [Nocardiopsis sp. MG754419]|uniref:SAF domain-containing protein n=1 Tax=Nocardiopsis sp. MG754419 TaxID=2259865 RepID=UPI001BA9DB94|nr:SAF domain-containing protein [Nocardiopsis sp. MG754419]MBR8742310.1 Flp pilus assembly protein CpaB [Nocardiopsis sp. MG754419]